MNLKAIPRPIKRSSIRILLGKIYYTFKRHIFWMFSGLRFAQINEAELPYKIFSHETPLIRNLKDVDIYLQYNKIVNLKIAVPKLSNVTLYPGEVFSYWKLIGKPTKRKGYLEGMVLKSGTVITGIGGGLCQLSNLIYWLTIHTPLTVIERHRHSYDVFPDSNRTQPFGSGATCFYNYGDLMIRNDTEQTFRLVIEMSDTHLKGTWTSNEKSLYKYEVYEKEHIINQEYWGGYTRHNLLYRKKYDVDESVVDDEFIAENHAVMMYAPLLPKHNK